MGIVPPAPAGAPAPPGPPVPAPNLELAVPVALDAGWTMAVLFGFMRDNPVEGVNQLPTENELNDAHRIEVELARLSSLLNRLVAALPPGSGLVADVTVLQFAYDNPGNGLSAKQALQAQLRLRNLNILKSLACTSHELILAYQLGRSLRDTANPPVHGDRTDANLLEALTTQVGRRRIAKLQQWLATLAPHLGNQNAPNSQNNQSADVVSGSIGRWSEFCNTVFLNASPGRLKRSNSDKEALASTFSEYLLDQGDVWRNLLVGAESTAGLLTPEAYVAAGEAALSRATRIIKRVILHYWAALAVLAIALAAVTFLSLHYLGGAAKVWTEIASIAGALGITAKGIGTTLGRLSEAAARPIYQQEELDAMAWAVTTLPPVRVTNRAVRELRRSGIQGSRSLSQV